MGEGGKAEEMEGEEAEGAEGVGGEAEVKEGGPDIENATEGEQFLFKCN